MFSTAYLEAQAKTQDLSTLKWVLRANNILIGSTWHDDAPSEPSQTHLHPMRLRRMRDCEALVVVQTQTGELGAELAMLIGLALGWELKVVWVGPPAAMLDQFGTAVSRFKTIEDLQTALDACKHPEFRAA
jgi:hypothetical protein